VDNYASPTEILEIFVWIGRCGKGGRNGDISVEVGIKVLSRLYPHLFHGGWMDGKDPKTSLAYVCMRQRKAPTSPAWSGAGMIGAGAAGALSLPEACCQGGDNAPKAWVLRHLGFNLPDRADDRGVILATEATAYLRVTHGGECS
jgi:hypothetical protein